MLQKYKSKIGADAILNFVKSGILGHSKPCVANIYQCTKFDQNIFIYDQDMAKNLAFKMAAAAILNFAKSGIFGRSYPCMAIIYQCVPNLMKISSITTEIWPKMENSRWRPPPCWFLRCNFGPQWLLYGKYLFANRIWCKSVQKLLRYACVYFQDGGRPPCWISFTLILDLPRRSPWWA